MSTIEEALKSTVAPRKREAVLILSGGMDSTVLLWHLCALGLRVHTMSFDYGQRHRHELKAAGAIADGKAASHTVVDLQSLTQAGVFAGSSQTSLEVAVPHGHYAAPTMKTTVVPNRNMVMLAIASAQAIALKADYVAYGAHGGDHYIYPDCRPDFVRALGEAVQLADWHKPSLLAPFIHFTKAEVAALGHQLGAPLKETWSCYDPQPDVFHSPAGSRARLIHCGKCGTCVERREAFAVAGIADLTEYAP